MRAEAERKGISMCLTVTLLTTALPSMTFKGQLQPEVGKLKPLNYINAILTRSLNELTWKWFLQYPPFCTLRFDEFFFFRRRVELLKRLAKWMFVFKNNLFSHQRFTAELPSSLSISDKDFLSRIECAYLGIFNRQRISHHVGLNFFYCPLVKLGLKLFKWQQLAYHC